MPCLYTFCVSEPMCDTKLWVPLLFQYENKRSIKEALNVYKKWNPTWCPGYFMVDFAEVEIPALENVFSSKRPRETISVCPWLYSFFIVV